MTEGPFEDYHGEIKVASENGQTFTAIFDFIGAIGLYKMSLGIIDEDSEAVSAALQVQLSTWIGP